MYSVKSSVGSEVDNKSYEYQIVFLKVENLFLKKVQGKKQALPTLIFFLNILKILLMYFNFSCSSVYFS